jgi:hypothetical protein
MASSTTSRGTDDASTPSETQSVSNPPATTSVCVMTRDHGPDRHPRQPKRLQAKINLS